MRPLTQLHHELLFADVMLTGHDPILETRTLHWPDEAGCAAYALSLARSVARSLARSEEHEPALHQALIELYGPLGAGKTTFVRHLLRGLGVTGRIKSPTYAVLESYELPGLAVSHLDLFRFNDAREWLDAGLRDVFAAPGLKLVEWPERAAGLLPTPDLQLFIEPTADEQRNVLVTALTPRGLVLLS